MNQYFALSHKEFIEGVGLDSDLYLYPYDVFQEADVRNKCEHMRIEIVKTSSKGVLYKIKSV